MIRKMEICVLLALIIAVNGEWCILDIEMKRRIERDGFHRELHSSVEIITNQSSIADCTLIQRETMPSGLFVNPNEIADLRRVGMLSACVPEDVDIESPKQLSSPHEILVYYKLRKRGRVLIGNFILPFHLRYHFPVFNGTDEEIIITEPLLYMRCDRDIPCLKSKPHALVSCLPCNPMKCEAPRVTYKPDELELKLKVPVGNTDNFATAVICTLITSIGGAAYLLTSLIQHWRIPNSN